MNALVLIQTFYYSYSRSWYIQVKDASNVKRAIVHFIVFVCPSVIDFMTSVFLVSFGVQK